MARILVLGTIAQDDVVHLAQPLQHGGHNQGTGRGIRLGGGGPNTSIPLAAAGHKVTIVAAVGPDEPGERLTRELLAAGIDIDQIAVVSGAATTRSVIMIDDEGERTIVNLGRTAEAEPPRRLLDVPADLTYVRSRVLDIAPLLAEKARHCPIVAHMPPWEAGCRPAQILVASESDLEPRILADPFGAGRGVSGDLLEWVVITRGGRGVTAYGVDRRISRPARRVKTVDTVGAGDAFAAGLLHGLASGQVLPDALDTALAWGTEATLWESSMLPAEAVQRLVAGSGS